MTQKLTFVNGAKAACGCRHEFSSGGGEYSDVAYVHLCALHAGGAPVLDDNWKARILDGRAPERDEMGLGDHPELPLLDEGMMPRSFFAALGLELAHTSAEDQLDGDVLGAMSEAVNWTDWQPTAPQGDGWKLVSIFDTEDGPAAWWLRALPEAEDGTTTIRNLQAEVEQLKARIARAGAAPAAVAPRARDLLGIVRTAQSEARRLINGEDSGSDLAQTKLDLPETLRVLEHALSQPLAVAGPAWDKTRHDLAIVMMGFAGNPSRSLEVAEIVLDAATEPGAPMAYLRGAQAAPAPGAPAAPCIIDIGEGGQLHRATPDSQNWALHQGHAHIRYLNKFERNFVNSAIRAALAAAPQAPAAPVDPMDWPLPCDVTVGHGTIRKGCKLRTLVLRMQVLYDLSQKVELAAPAAPQTHAGLLAAAAHIQAKAQAHLDERGSYDPDTGAVEMSESNQEYFNTLDELAEEIRLLADKAAPASCDKPPAGWNCSRAPGHDGPCAAAPAAPAVDESFEDLISDWAHGDALDAEHYRTLSQAARDVLAERRRQVNAEGFSPERDDQYVGGQLAGAAISYLILAAGGREDEARAFWPWRQEWLKPGSQRRYLEKACALGLAEMERQDRAAAAKKGGEV